MDISDRETRLTISLLFSVKPHGVLLNHMEVPDFFLMKETEGKK
jgi:hypothetical protein